MAWILSDDVGEQTPQRYVIEDEVTPQSQRYILEDVPKPKVEKLPFKAKHPTLYGIGRGAIVETGKELSKVAWLKYLHKDERKKFSELTGMGEDAKWYEPKTKKQAQVRALLLADMELAALTQFGPLMKDIKYLASSTFGKLFPKSLKKSVKTALTKPRYLIEDGAKTVAKGAEVVTKPIAPEIEEVTKILTKAKPIRALQEEIYTLERGVKIKAAKEVGKKVYGETGYYAKLGKMKGEMSRVEFHSIRKELTPEKINKLFAHIEDSGKIDAFEKLTAGRGLAKIFGEFGGGVPTETELKFLTEVFGEKFTKAVLSKRSLFAKGKEVGLELANIPRALMASFDLSAPLRQGVFLIGRPKQWIPAFVNMFRYFVSEKAYVGLGEEIASRPTYKLMKQAGLSLTELGGKMSTREEAFMSSWAEKIPIIGRGVRWSSRAYTGFLNKLRADVFDDIIKKGASLGIEDARFVKDVANFINHATGRGTLPLGLEKVAVPLNASFFSPRLIMSRLNLLNPAFYANLHPQARKEALTSLFTFGATASTVAGLAVLGGADVGLDPRSADFMKIKFGNKRYDILGGFQQPIRMAVQVISGEVVSSTTGKVMTLGEGYRGLTRTEIISRFVESKEAPLLSLATALLRGRNSRGELVDVPTEVANRFIPMVLQDMKDFYEEEGIKGIPMVIPAFFGVGAMSYGGVQSYGLHGKNYPKLNAELNRLKTSMGYPSSVAFGQELNIKEYKQLKKQTGTDIAKELKILISNPDYIDLDDKLKINLIEKYVDEVKAKTKERMFPKKQYKAAIMRELKATEGLTGKDAEKAAEEFIKKESLYK